MRTTWQLRMLILLVVAGLIGIASRSDFLKKSPAAQRPQISPKRSAFVTLPPLTEFQVTSTIDGTTQPSTIWAPPSAKSEPTPLFVFVHSWSSDYHQDNSKWFREAVPRGWIYLHPNFRGVNDKPQACGSHLARQDVLDAMDYVLANYNVDTSRIYLAGSSGGGHMSMLMSGYHPDRFSAVSAWVGISDLADWYRFHARTGIPQRYARMIAASCGGAPGTSTEVDAQYRERSPIYHIHNAVGLPLDINSGVYDGKTGSVPILQSLRAFNAVARAGDHTEIPEDVMEKLWATGRLANPQPSDLEPDPTHERKIHLRRHAGQARVTIFEGGHESFPFAACSWLAKQQRETDPAKLKQSELQ